MKKLLTIIVTCFSACSAATEQPYSDHDMKEFNYNGIMCRVLNICGKPGAANIFPGQSAGEINVSPVYRLPILIKFFSDPKIKSALNRFVIKMDNKLAEVAERNGLKKTDIAQCSKEELETLNRTINAISIEMQEYLITAGRMFGLEAVGIGGWSFMMKPSKIFPKGVLSPAFFYETQTDFEKRFERGIAKLMGSVIVFIEELDRGAEYSETLFNNKVVQAYPHYQWVTSIKPDPKTPTSCAMIGYDARRFAQNNEAKIVERSKIIGAIFTQLLFSNANTSPQPEKVCVVALNENGNSNNNNGQIVYTVNIHADYLAANKDQRVYALMRQLFDLVPGLVLGADVNAQVGKIDWLTGEKGIFAGFKGMAEFWPTPESGDGSNPTLDCFIASAGGSELINLDAQLQALLEQATKLNYELFAKKS